MPPQPPPPPHFLSTVLNNSASTSPQARNPYQIPANTPLTPAQQSLQARNKPFSSPAAVESYELRQKRDRAAGILENTETLLWYSAARNESISQTRQHFMNIVLGIPDEKKKWSEEWDIPLEKRTRSADVEMTGTGSSPARGKGGSGKERRKRHSEAHS